MITAYLGIGSNLGDRSANLRSAIRELDRREKITVKRTSGFYETEPSGCFEPGAQKFFNAVVEVETDLDPIELLDRLQEIERSIGRDPPFKESDRCTRDLPCTRYDHCRTTNTRTRYRCN